MEGLNRKAVVTDNLQGVKETPVTINGGGVGSPNVPRAPDTSFSQRINQQVGNFVGGQLKKAVALKQDRDFMDGQMAFAQGKAFEDVEMDGNKWALEGYRVVQAQTISSGMLTAQEEEINAGGYEQSPDAFRNQFVSRAEGMIKNTPDGRTGELVREQLLKQMPVLVRGHTKAHLAWKEKQNYQNLETSVDVISRDPTSQGSLISFAKGEKGSATAGLTPERRRSAVHAGVIRAFDNDNPLAYATLSKAGLLNADNMTAQQINSLRAARKRFENRRRTEYDADMFKAEQDLLKQVTNGGLSPTAAAEALSTLYAEHNIEVTKAEIGAIYHQAETGVKIKELTTTAVNQEAILRGDVDHVTNIVSGHSHKNADVTKYLIEGKDHSAAHGLTEKFRSRFSSMMDAAPAHIKKGLRMYSGNRSVAHQERLWKRALKKYGSVAAARKWVAPPGRSNHNHGNAADLSYNGVRLDKVSPAIRKEIHALAAKHGMGFRMGHEPWHIEPTSGGTSKQRGMAQARTKIQLTSLKRDGLFNKLNSKIGNRYTTPESVVSAINDVGYDKVAEFLRTGKGEAGKLFTTTDPTAVLMSPQEKLAKARGRLEVVKERVALVDYEGFQHKSAEIDNLLSKKVIDEAQWLQLRREAQGEYNQAVTKASIEKEISTSKMIATELEAQVDNDNALAAGIQMRQAQAQFTQVVDAFAKGEEVTIGGVTRKLTANDVATARNSFQQTRNQIAADNDIDVKASDELSAVDGIVEKLTKAVEQRTKYDEGTVIIGQAEASGTLDQLTPQLQKRAVKEYEQSQLNKYQDAIAAGKIDPQQAQAALSKDMLTYYGKTGLVDETTKQVMNGFLQQDWIVDGKPNPQVVDAVNNIKTITDVNPAMLEKYIPNDDTRARVMAALNRAGGGPVDNAIFSIRNNELKPSQVKDRANELNLDSVEQSLRTWSMNAANDTQVQVWGDVFQPKAEHGGAHLSSETGILGAILSDKAETGQFFDRTGEEFKRLLQPDGDAQTLMRDSVKAEARRLMTDHAGVMSVEEAITTAQQTIQTRGAFVGGDFVLFPKGESVLDTIFGSEAKNVDTVDATNRAIMNYLRTPEMQAAYPYLSKTRSWADWWSGNIGTVDSIVGGTGVRPFRTNMVQTANGPALQLHVLDANGGYTQPVLLSKKDLRKAGMNLVDKLRNN